MLISMAGVFAQGARSPPAAIAILLAPKNAASRPHRAMSPGRQSAVLNFGKCRRRPPARVLKVSRAVLTKMPHFRALRFLVLEDYLASRAHTLRLSEARPARHFDVVDSSIGAEMPSDREIIDNANSG
jgi:hypothetical protein